ncbi:hereditary hemochromatosis protein [Pimephales promelas]|nr:hereditary hemochromatosis protein [Pimephales promelas]
MASITVLLLISALSSSQSESHSLYYTHSAVSKSLMSGEVYEFYNSVKLDDLHLSVCERVNKADFMTRVCEESEGLFNESDDLHYKQQWLQINIKTLMDHERNENGTRDTDLHVLQWRHGCEVERRNNGSVMLLQGSDEYAYDGETLTFDLSVHWKPLVLDHDIIWDRESVSSLERRCVETLTRFTELQRERNFIMESRPRVHTGVKASGSSGSSLLVCLATGFYPKHVQMEIRRDQTPFPEDHLKSEGIRPNADGSFQLKKSLEILPSDTAQYQCVVKHQTRTEALVISWEEVNVLLPLLVGSIVSVVVLAIILLVFYLLRKCVKRRKLPESPELLSLISFPTSESSDLLARNYAICLPGSVRTLQDEDSELSEMELWFTDRFRPETCEAALHTDSEEEDPADPSVEEGHTEDLHDTQSLCETEATAAARGAMGPKNISLPNVAMEREDADQNTVTQNALLLPLPRRCRSKDISLPNLTQDRKDSDDSS